MLTVSGNLHARIELPPGLNSGRRLPGRLEVKVNFPVNHASLLPGKSAVAISGTMW